MKTLMFVLAAFLLLVTFAVVSAVRRRAAEAEAGDDKPWPFYFDQSAPRDHGCLRDSAIESLYGATRLMTLRAPSTEMLAMFR